MPGYKWESKGGRDNRAREILREKKGSTYFGGQRSLGPA